MSEYLKRCIIKYQYISGVSQGGILSPLLFPAYVDSVLEKLCNSKLGCFVKCRCFNSYMFADDLILLSISISDLHAAGNAQFMCISL